jgi:hypothetical protein
VNQAMHSQPPGSTYPKNLDEEWTR